jgi:hypothetical protein
MSVRGAMLGSGRRSPWGGVLGVGALTLAAACDAQVAPEYSGEPLARIRGMAIGFDDGETASGAAVRWNTQRDADLTAGPLQALPLRTRPPAGVLLEVVTTPVAAGYFGFADEPARIAEGTLFLTEGEVLVGEAIDFALVHVDGEVAPGSLAAAYLGGELTPGFHLMDVRATAELTPAQAYFAARCEEGDADSAACRAARLYELLPMPEDLDTSLPFFARLRAAP